MKRAHGAHQDRAQARDDRRGAGRRPPGELAPEPRQRIGELLLLGRIGGERCTTRAREERTKRGLLPRKVSKKRLREGNHTAFGLRRESEAMYDAGGYGEKRRRLERVA